MRLSSAIRDSPSQIVAWGDIPGAPNAEGSVVLGLQESNNSGHYGAAWLEADRGSDQAVIVTVFIA